MKKKLRKYSSLERKVDQLWQVYDDDGETEKFWRVYNGFLAQAKAKGPSNYQNAAPLSTKTYRSAVNQTSQLPRRRHSIKAHVYVLCLAVLFLVIGTFIKNSFTKQPVASKKPIVQPVANDELVYEPPNIDTTYIYSWQHFDAKKSCEIEVEPALPDSLVIAYYKVYIARKRQTNLDKRMQGSSYMKEKYDSLWRQNKQRLAQVWKQYQQVYNAYAKARKKKELNLVNYQSIENAWHKVMHKSRLPKNIDKHNKPVYEFVVNDEAQWLFFANIEALDLHRVRRYKGSYFIINPQSWPETIKFKSIDLATQIIHKAQIKVYYQGQLVTYTPQKVYYELNGKQHKIAIKDFDKLEKRMEVTKYQPLVKE